MKTPTKAEVERVAQIMYRATSSVWARVANRRVNSWNKCVSWEDYIRKDQWFIIARHVLKHGYKPPKGKGK